MTRAGSKNDGIVVRIVYTDGVESLDLLWLTHSGTDVYFGCPADKGAHISYHASGERRGVSKAGKREVWWTVPLRDVNPFASLQTIAFPNSSLHFANPIAKRYRRQPASIDSVLSIDQRAFPEDFILNAHFGVVRREARSTIIAMGQAMQRFSEGAQAPVILFDERVSPSVYVILLAFPNQLAQG